MIENREEVQRIDREGVVAHQNRWRPLAVLAAWVSGYGSLAAL
jgi:hypothetical protein